MGRIIKAVVAMALIAGSSQVQAQGSAGTGNTSTGIGAQGGPAGPGRRGDLTQQPGTATNRTAGSSNLSPAQKNAIPRRMRLRTPTALRNDAPDFGRPTSFDATGP